MNNGYKQLWKLIHSYWGAYGGVRALLRSPFLHCAIVITGISYHKWMYDDWWVTPTDILPSLIGFTLGGYAILLAFGDHRFLDLMRQSGSDSEPSAYMDINAVFLHFLLLQFIALILALLAGESSLGVVISSALLERSSTGQLIFTFLEDVYGFISYLFFSYSLLAGLAAALAIFEVGSAYDKAH